MIIKLRVGSYYTWMALGFLIVYFTYILIVSSPNFGKLWSDYLGSHLQLPSAQCTLLIWLILQVIQTRQKATHNLTHYEQFRVTCVKIFHIKMLTVSYCVHDT